MQFKEFIKPSLKKVIVFVIIAVILSVGLWLIFGVSPFWSVINTEAMKPSYNYGDIVFIKNTNFDDISVSDVIVYHVPMKGNIIMRVISLNESERTFTTMGDNVGRVQFFEEKISEDQILGEVAFSIPFWGYLELYKIGLILRVIILYIIACFISLLFIKKK